MYRGFPYNSIKYLLSKYKINPSDITKIIYCYADGIYPKKEIKKKILERIKEGLNEKQFDEKKYMERLNSEIKLQKKLFNNVYMFLKKFKLSKKKLICFDHHKCHAASAFYFNNFKNQIVFTCDGKGNYLSSAAWIYKNNDLKMLNYSTTFDSIGYFYGNITRVLGFTPEKHEGKVTGLAAYGKYNKIIKIFRKFFFINNGKIKSVWSNYHLPWFVKKSNLPEIFKLKNNFSKEDIASGVQKLLEEVICEWIIDNIKIYKKKKIDISLAGGVFGNVKLIYEIKKIKYVNNIFIQPATGDAGLSLGGLKLLINRKSNLNTTFLGSSYSNNEIIKYLKKKKKDFKYIKNVEQILINLFKRKKVVGFFRGRMEFGYRALCNRSILYHAKDKSVNKWLNKRLNRTEFMPFAPVTIAPLAKKCFLDWNQNDKTSKFMLSVYKCSNLLKSKAPAVVHVDGTARPQVIDYKDDPEMFEILSNYFNKTGEIVLINTSFNNHEEPIVESPNDAINSMLIGNVDNVIFNNSILI